MVDSKKLEASRREYPVGMHVHMTGNARALDFGTGYGGVVHDVHENTIQVEVRSGLDYEKHATILWWEKKFVVPDRKSIL